MEQFKLNFSDWPKKFGVYRIINIKNQKSYIGSAFNLNERLKQHLHELTIQVHFNQHLQRSFIKYGVDAFVVELLEVFDTPIQETELLQIEEQYILKFNTIDAIYGYNKRLNFTFPELSEKSKQKRKEKSELRKQPVMLFNAETGEFFKEFDSVTDVAEFLNDQTTNVSKCCNSMLTRSCKGYTMIKKSEYDSNKDYKKIKKKRIWTEEQKEKSRTTNKKSIKLYVYDINNYSYITFSSLSKVDQYFSFTTSGCSHTLKRKNGCFKYKNYLFINRCLDFEQDDLIEIYESAFNYIPFSKRNQFT